MTFLEEVKDELLNSKIKKNCCMTSEIRGVLLFGGIPFGENVIFGTDNFRLAKRFSNFLRKVCNIDFAQRLDEHAESYKFLIPEDILNELGIRAGAIVEPVDDRETDFCCMRAFIRGAFLASGSAANPERAYRVELFSENEKAADKVLEIFGELAVAAKKTKRKSLFVIYGNSCETASDMLKVTEATFAVFKMLDAKVQKERRNDTNRQINCDMANIDRVNENSRREADAIKLIASTVGLDSLKPKLKEAAILRLENEGASLKELCELCEPPLPKSTLNNRLNKLIEIAKELGD